MKKWIFLFIVLSGCKNEPDTSTEKEAVKATLTAMWLAIEKHDSVSYAKYIHPNFTQFGETDSILRVGKSAETTAMNDWMKHTENVHTEMHEPLVTVKDQVAWVIYYWSDSGKQDGKAFATKGKSTRIFIKENNQWLCIHGHYTLLP